MEGEISLGILVIILCILVLLLLRLSKERFYKKGLPLTEKERIFQEKFLEWFAWKYGPQPKVPTVKQQLRQSLYHRRK